MSIVEKCVIHDWKRIWQMVSGIHYETPQDTVREELLNVSSELQAGVLQFKPKSASSVQLAALLKEKKQEKLLPFTKRLQELLNLESAQCWEILCYYLTKEYRGSASLLTQLISTETNMAKLLEDIRHYYSLERMIVFKVLKNVLVFYKVPNHPYHNEYREVVQKLSLPRLLESYLDQLDTLINELPPRKLLAGECFHSTDRLISWSERNAREINEVLHILLLISEHLPLEVVHIKRIFQTVKQHSFGRVQHYLDESNTHHLELIRNLIYSELMLLLKCLDFEQPNEGNNDKVKIEQLIEDLHMEVASLHHRPEHGPLLLIWMLLRLRGTNDADDATSLLRCRQLGKRAVELKCFVQLHDIVKHAMFADDSLLSRIVRKTIYNQLCYLCDLFDSDGSCARHEGIYELLCELIAWPQLAKDFCNREDDGVRSLYNTLLENFPLRFTNLAKLAQALTKAGQGNFIKSQLESLPMLALLYDEKQHKLVAVTANQDEFELGQSVKPFPCIDYTLPAGTSCTAVQHPTGYYLHFRCNVNFFHALHHEINCLLREKAQLHGDFESNERVLRVEAGLKYLVLAVERTKSIAGISTEMVHPTEMCVDLISKFKCVQYPPVGLLSSCLNVCTALLPLVDEEIYRRITNLDILPTVSNESLQDYKLYASAVCFESRFLGSVIDNVEKKRERYDFLLAYLSFLRTYTKLKRGRYMQVEIPGLIFLLRDVFPHLHTWHFRSQLEKNKIYFEVLSFICDLFDIIGVSSSNEKQCKQRQLLLNVCVYSLLNLDTGLILLRFVGVGNAFVQYTMELETNWMQQQPHGLMMLVRLSMRILMQVLSLKSHVYSSNTLSPLEALIYTQPKQRDTLRIIPTVCSYMSNIFDRWLPIVSCRLLKRIALEFNMSLLACLDMEADQIRLTFMQKLPDELESDSVKIAILELVDACIAKQPGVTEAFFKVNYVNDKRSFFGKECAPSIGDSIVTYMQEFLDALEAEPLTIQQMLPCKIMNIFHSLWKHNLQMLVDELLKQPRFWTKLCGPLFLSSPTCHPQPQVRVYTQLINIVSIEIYSCRGNNQNEELREVMTKFFERDCFKKWLNYIFDMPKEPAVQQIEELPDWICCLQSFKDLIVILLKKQPEFISIPNPQFKLLAEKCLTVLVDRANYLEDMRPFIMLAELYIFILLQFKHAYTDSGNDEQQLMEELLQLMSRICSCYEDLHVRAKEACLAIITKCAHLYTNLLIRDSSIALRFLNSVVSIICTELQSMEKSVNVEQLEHMLPTAANDANGKLSANSLILCLNLLKTVATIFINDGPGNWDLPFVSVRLFQRLLRCISFTLPLHRKQALSMQLLDVLIVFAKSNCSVEFLHCDVGEHLWLKLLPPRELLQGKYEFNKAATDVWTMEHWWPIYARGIELINIIYDKHKKCFLQEVLQFVGIHEVYLVDSLLLGKQSLEPAAMQLIKASISLVASLTEHHKEWAQDHASSLFNIMRAVQGLMCHATSMFHQQRNLKCLLSGRRSQLEILRNTDNIQIDDDIVNACNDLTDIIIYCVKALQKLTPDLLDLLCSSFYEAHKWQPILDVQFGAPKLNDGNLTLTFGMVLNMITIYVKALNMQNHGFHEVPLNTLPNVELSDVTSMSTVIASDTTRGPRTFTKSLSTNSISSVACLSNELLSNLDGQLCLVALEHLLMLVASQSMYVIRSPDLEPRWKQIVRRDISSELLSFHEFVRRKVIVDYRDSRCQWVRRKHGLVKFQQLQAAATSNATTNQPRSGNEVVRRNSSTANDLRVNVVRRLHLQQQQNATTSAAGNFEISRVLSPIAPNSPQTAAHQLAASTPQVLPALTETPNRKRLCRFIYPDMESTPTEVQYFPASREADYCELSQVQLVEEDYLQLMSALFSVIPQNE